MVILGLNILKNNNIKNMVFQKLFLKQDDKKSKYNNFRKNLYKQFLIY